jgi:hypothetical protein
MEKQGAIRDMLQRRRNEGLLSFEIHTIMEGLSLVVHILTFAIAIPPSLLKVIFITVATALLDTVQRAAQFIRNRMDPIDPTNKH